MGLADACDDRQDVVLGVVAERMETLRECYRLGERITLYPVLQFSCAVTGVGADLESGDHHHAYF